MSKNKVKSRRNKANSAPSAKKRKTQRPRPKDAGSSTAYKTAVKNAPKVEGNSLEDGLFSIGIPKITTPEEATYAQAGYLAMHQRFQKRLPKNERSLMPDYIKMDDNGWAYVNVLGRAVDVRYDDPWGANARVTSICLMAPRLMMDGDHHQQLDDHIWLHASKLRLEDAEDGGELHIGDIIYLEGEPINYKSDLAQGMTRWGIGKWTPLGIEFDYHDRYGLRYLADRGLLGARIMSITGKDAEFALRTEIEPEIERLKASEAYKQGLTPSSAPLKIR